MSQLGEDQIQAQLKLGSSQLELGQLRAAEKSFNTLLRHQPAHSEALLGLAEIARRRNKPKKQRELLEELISVHPQHLAGALALSRLLCQQDPERALPWIERALEAQPRQPELLLAAAECLQRGGEHARAMVRIEQLLQLQAPPGLRAKAWLQLARLSMRLGDLTRAAEGFERAAAEDPALRAHPDWVDLDASWKALEANAMDPSRPTLSPGPKLI